MSERAQVVAASIVGAVIGALAGYLFLTEQGRALRRNFEPGIEDAARELSRLTGTVLGAAGAAREGWRIVRDAIDRADFHRYPTSGQSSPF